MALPDSSTLWADVLDDSIMRWRPSAAQLHTVKKGCFAYRDERATPASLPEVKLMIAVLCRAILDAAALLERSSKRGQIQTEALRWIYLGEDEAREPFSFVWICEQLGLSPDHIREVTQRFRELNAAERFAWGSILFPRYEYIEDFLYRMARDA